MSPEDGIVLVDKPAEATSYAVVERIRRALEGRASDTGRRRGRKRTGRRRLRVGHAGTLDPLATGLLVVMTGRATRLAPFLIGLDKTYVASVRFGVATDTLDRDGRVTTRAEVPLDPGALESALAAFLGEIEQVPPLYSALKSGGRALHARVRAGERVAAPRARRIRIDRLAAAPLAWGAAPAIGDVSATRASDAATGDVPGAVAASAADGLIYEARLAVQCSSGTYVRALARDLAERIGTVAHVRELRRLSVGPFTVAEALAPAVLGCAAELRRARRPLETVLPHVPRIVVSADEAEDLRNGRQPPADWQARYVTAAGVGAAELLQVHDPADRLVAVCRREPTTAIWRTAAVFPLAIAQARAEGNEES